MKLPGLVAAAALAAILVCSAAGAQSSDAPTVEVEPLMMFNQHLYYGTFERPKALAFDREHGELWVAESGSGRIGVFKPDGSELYSFSSKDYTRDATRIAVAPGGRMVAVVEGDHAHVRLFNYRGDYKGDLAIPGIEGKRVLGAIAYDADGGYYVADNASSQVYVYRPDGTLKFQFGSRGTDEGQFMSVCGITIDAAGQIYVIDQQALAVQVFDSQGNFLRGWGRHEMGGEHFSLPSGIALDSKGRILVSDELRHQVKIFSPEGHLLMQFGGLGTGTGQLSFPTDVAIDDKDRVYVSERSTARVQVFRLSDVAPTAAAATE